MSPTYVALGSSMAAGPGIAPRAPGSPWRAGRSARNYAHLAAERLGFDLVDVTYSGATTAHVLTDHQNGVPPQIETLTPEVELVTITIGGNDVGYIPVLMAAAAPRFLRRLPILGSALLAELDPAARDAALLQVAESLRRVGEAVRARAPRSTVLFVDYLTLLPPSGTPAAPLSEADADLGRHIAARLEDLTAEAAAATGCGVIRAGQASRDHHAWSSDPWTIGARGSLLPLPGKPVRFHPNHAGMQAVADLVLSAAH